MQVPRLVENSTVSTVAALKAGKCPLFSFAPVSACRPLITPCQSASLGANVGLLKENAAKSVVIEGVQNHSSASVLLRRQRTGVQPHISRLCLCQLVGEIPLLIALLLVCYAMLLGFLGSQLLFGKLRDGGRNSFLLVVQHQSGKQAWKCRDDRAPDLI